MNTQARSIPASSNPHYLGRRVMTEYQLYCEPQPGQTPVVKAEGMDKETALAVLNAVNFTRTGDETYFLVRVTFEVVP